MTNQHSALKMFRLTLLLLLACAGIANAQHPVPSTPDTLQPNFSGDDPVTLLRQLSDLRKRLVKSEFETTQAYEARIIEEKKKPVIGNRTIEDTFYLVAHGVQAEYDADTQIMSFSLPVQRNYAAEVSRSSSLDKKTITDLSRVATYQVSLGGPTNPHVFFDSGGGLTGPGSNQKFTATAKLDVEKAKRLKTEAKAVLIVQFVEPYAAQEYLEGGQFLVRLVDLQFFDPQTGRFLGRVAFTESASQIKENVKPDYSSYRNNPSFKKLRMLSKPDAGYTEEARRNNITGQVLLDVLFAETGQITQIRVVKGLPYGLTERAIAAARQITFEPAELDGKKVAYPLRVVYNFRLP